MTRSAPKAFRVSTVAATVSLAVMLTMSVSHSAMAACGPPTNNNDNVATCNDANVGSFSLQGGNDKLTINKDAVLTTNANNQNITGGVGNDLIVINGGDIRINLNPGTGATSVGDTDRIFMFGGKFTDAEAQTGSGKNNFFFFMGGTVEGGGLEINRGSVDTVFVFDGGTAIDAEMFEFQNGNGGVPNAARSPVFYFRSGTIDTEEIEFGANDLDGVSRTNVTVVFDPVNSKDATYFQTLANAAANGDDASISTDNLLKAIASAPANPNSAHTLVVKAEGIGLGAGNDHLIFEGANNFKGGNLVLQGEEEDDEPGEYEITELEGGNGVDRLTVRGGSLLQLGEVEEFEHLAVTGGSSLTLGESEYEFEESVTIDGTSVLHLPGSDVTLTTEHFELQGGAGSGRLAGLPDYYNTFATGGILRVGALPGAAGGDDDDDEEEEDGDDDEAGGGPAKLTIHTGATTFVNGGTITTLNGVVGDQVIINGPYVSQGGNLAVDAVLGGDGASDNLTINGAVTGTTTIFVNNVGGAGALTAGNGIAIVTSGAGAFQPNAFRLAVNALSGREEVIAGPYAYRLAIAGGSAVLQSDLLDQVPAYTTAPSVGQRLVSGGLDTLYKRLGEIRSGRNEGATSADGLVWVRGHYADFDVDANKGNDFSQRTSGVLFGIGGTIAGEGRSRLAVGAFGGYSNADANVDAVIFGGNPSASVDADGWSAGAYASYYEVGRLADGLYVDSVVKVDFIDFDMAAGGVARGSTDGDAITGSAEVGYGFAFGGGLVVQPQAQISYTDLSMSNFKDVPYGLAVSYGASESLVGRLGLQVLANWAQPGGGFVSPYAIVNVHSEFEGNGDSKINGVKFANSVDGTWYSAGGGVNAQLANNLSLYGAGEYHFGDLQGWQGTGGVKLNW